MMVFSENKVKQVPKAIGSKQKLTTTEWVDNIIRHIANEKGCSLAPDYTVGKRVKDITEIVWWLPETIMSKKQWRDFADTFKWRQTNSRWGRGELKAYILASLVHGYKQTYRDKEMYDYVAIHAETIGVTNIRLDNNAMKANIPLHCNKALDVAVKRGLYHKKD